MDENLIKVFFTPLQQFVDEKGVVKRMMRTGDIGYDGFAEVYCSSVVRGAIKGWKKHKEMTLNLCVLKGTVKFYVHVEELNQTQCFELGDDCYGRLTVLPGVWLAFEGIGERDNLIVNTANLVHDPSEAESKPLSAFSLEG